MTYFTSTGLFFLNQAEWFCKINGGELPEIRSESQREEVRKYAIESKIQKFTSGIVYNSRYQKFQMKTDNADAALVSSFPLLEYGGSYGPGSVHVGKWHDDATIRAVAHNSFVVYINPKENFLPRLADIREATQEKARILCQQQPVKPPVNTARKSQANMLAMTTHNCRRDKQALIDASKAAIQNAVDTTNLKIDEQRFSSEELNEFLPKLDNFQILNRRKQSPYDFEKSNNDYVEHLFGQNAVEKSIKEVVSFIKDDTLTTVAPDTSEHFQMARIIYNQLKPTMRFNAWIENVITKVSALPAHLTQRRSVKPFSASDLKNMNCIKSAKCMQRRSLQEKSYIHRYLTRQAQKVGSHIII